MIRADADVELLRLCGLDDFGALRASAKGFNSDNRVLKARVHICLRAFPTAADIIAARAVKFRIDRALWTRHYQPALAIMIEVNARMEETDE